MEYFENRESGNLANKSLDALCKYLPRPDETWERDLFKTSTQAGVPELSL